MTKEKINNIFIISLCLLVEGIILFYGLIDPEQDLDKLSIRIYTFLEKAGFVVFFISGCLFYFSRNKKIWIVTGIYQLLFPFILIFRFDILETSLIGYVIGFLLLSFLEIHRYQKTDISMYKIYIIPVLCVLSCIATGIIGFTIAYNLLDFLNFHRSLLSVLDFYIYYFYLISLFCLIFYYCVIAYKLNLKTVLKIFGGYCAIMFLGLTGCIMAINLPIVAAIMGLFASTSIMALFLYILHTILAKEFFE